MLTLSRPCLRSSAFPPWTIGSSRLLVSARSLDDRQRRADLAGLEHPARLQLEVQAERVVHICQELRRYQTQNSSDAFDAHRTHLLSLSL
jgi:hypothetical protein